MVMRNIPKEVLKYLTGYNIHREYSERRENNQNGSLALNYAGEAARLAVRLSPLVLDATLLYNHITDSQSPWWLYLDPRIMYWEGIIILGKKEME